jgi:Histidine kinase-, DNA gyrase B-, and HSP90-like ATPase
MRALGYSFETAVADIVDNSIAANAQAVDIWFSPFGKTYVAILDDGNAMSADELFEAMRHGTKGPKAGRTQHDLGRFGLGLKTASLSQCRQMTVLTKKDGATHGAEWNLEAVERAEDWALHELEPADIAAVPHANDLSALDEGTLVVWRELDRALAGESDPVRALQDHIDEARDHMSLVFHRFLEGKSPLLEIRINGDTVRPVDPFLRSCKGGQTMPPETLQIDDATVTIEAHILPHISKLSASEMALAGGEEGLRRNQGFYVYRNRRLITWGTWFRLARQEEMTKLARVQVDIPNSLDHLWSLDIKKAFAHPPEPVRRGLRQIVSRIADRSKRVYTFRGHKGWAPEIVPAWKRYEGREGRFRYEINRDHQLLQALREEIPDGAGPTLERFIQMLETTFPFDSAYADMASDRKPEMDEATDDLADRLLDTAMRMLASLDAQPALRARLLDQLEQIDPFCKHPAVAKKIKEQLQ